MLYVVAYDIPDDRRRALLAKALLSFGVRVQESVFECDLRDRSELDSLLNRLRPLLAAEQGDRVRVYRLCADCRQQIVIVGEGQVTRDEDLLIV